MLLTREYVDGNFDLADLPGAEGNPFFTSGYLSSRRAVGDIPWLVGVEKGANQCLWGLVFITRGRFSCWLEMPSMPNFIEDSHYWDSLLDFCKRQAVTSLSVNSYGSSGGKIPVVSPREKRVARCEYLLDLEAPQLFTSMRKGHKHNLSKARKAGLQLLRRVDSEAVKVHTRLIVDSMRRRQGRGEDVSLDTNTEVLSALVNTGSGELFQAVLNDRVVASNLILLSSRAGYNQSQGSSIEGTECGAAHFLIHEAGLALRDEGKFIFNLGGSQGDNMGLERFKTGFGAALEQRPLESLSVPLGWRGANLFRHLLAR